MYILINVYLRSLEQILIIKFIVSLLTFFYVIPLTMINSLNNAKINNGRVIIILPKVIISHHNQPLSLDAKSVECLTINVHFANDKPKPDNAP